MELVVFFMIVTASEVHKNVVLRDNVESRKVFQLDDDKYKCTKKRKK